MEKDEIYKHFAYDHDSKNYGTASIYPIFNIIHSQYTNQLGDIYLKTTQLELNHINYRYYKSKPIISNILTDKWILSSADEYIEYVRRFFQIKFDEIEQRKIDWIFQQQSILDLLPND